MPGHLDLNLDSRPASHTCKTCAHWGAAAADPAMVERFGDNTERWKWCAAIPGPRTPGFSNANFSCSEYQRDPQRWAELHPPKSVREAGDAWAP
jgi:hypothetical protein